MPQASAAPLESSEEYNVVSSAECSGVERSGTFSPRYRRTRPRRSARAREAPRRPPRDRRTCDASVPSTPASPGDSRRCRTRRRVGGRRRRKLRSSGGKILNLKQILLFRSILLYTSSEDTLENILNSTS